MIMKQFHQAMKYSDEILMLIDDQLRNDENTLTRSDLQSAVDALMHKIMRESASKAKRDNR